MNVLKEKTGSKEDTYPSPGPMVKRLRKTKTKGLLDWQCPQKTAKILLEQESKRNFRK